MSNKKQKSGSGCRNKDNVDDSTAQKSSCKKKTKSNNEKPAMTEQEILSFSKLQVLQQAVLDLKNSDEESREMIGLSNLERKEVHLFGRQHELKTRSRSMGEERVLTISRSHAYRKKNMCLDEVKLAMSLEFKGILDKALTELHYRRTLPIPPQRPEPVSQGGGLLGKARVPPHPRRINKKLATERRELPIYARRNELLDLLDISQVIIVNGATGSGKSTQIPQYLLEAATARNQPVRIVVSQPRRIAAISVASRIAEERAETLGNTVGFIIRMESNFSDNTVLALTTSGCLLRILAMRGIDFFESATHVIIDEVHDRDLNTDFLLLALKLELNRNKSLKVILMSATMDMDALSKYFGKAPILNVEGRSFNVRVYSLEKILHMTGYMTPQMDRLLGNNKNPDENQLLAAYSAAHHSNEQNIDNSLIVSLLQVLLFMGTKGAVIVYLPGYQDMTKLIDQLVSALPLEMVNILLLHSQVDRQNQKYVFEQYRDRQLKIVLSTNIGQTSITIPDLLYVIDTGRVKMNTYDTSTGASHLACTWISQADAQQRTGRAGRRTDGICYRLYSTNQYNSFDCFTIPEILRHTLDEICLLAKIAAPNKGIEEFLSQALDRPKSQAIAQSCARLKLLGILCDEGESVTQLGRLIAELPLDVHLGKCLIYSLYYQCLGSLTIITAYYSMHDPFLVSSDRGFRHEQRKPQHFFSLDAYSDSIGILQLYHKFIATKKLSGSHEIDKFCEKYSLCKKSMNMFASAVVTLRQSMMRLFKFEVISAKKYDKNLNMVRMALTAGLYPRLVYVDHTKNSRLIDETDPRVLISRNSCLSLCFAKRQKTNTSDWILYVEKTRTAGLVSYIEHATLVSTLMVALQCGKVIKLDPCVPDITNNEEENYNQVDHCILRIDSWVRIRLSAELGAKIMQLRSYVAQELEEVVTTRTMLPSRCPSVDYINQLLELDADHSGLSATDIVFT